MVSQAPAQLHYLWYRTKESFDGEDLKDVRIEQLTKFTTDELRGKALGHAEEFYFDGAEQAILAASVDGNG